MVERKSEDEINGRMIEAGRPFNGIKPKFIEKKKEPWEVKAEIIRKIACKFWTTTKKQKKTTGKNGNEFPEN